MKKLLLSPWAKVGLFVLALLPFAWLFYRAAPMTWAPTRPRR